MHLDSRSKANASTIYFINGLQLGSNSCVKDLGVKVDSKLDFKMHICDIISKATQRAAIFFRGFTSRNLFLARKCYVTYIRPLLEYNSNIWNPCNIYIIDKLEKVQRQFSKRIPCLSQLSYFERLSNLNLEPLELRRLHFDLIQYYKILNGLTSLDFNK